MSITLSGHTQTKTTGVSWGLTYAINPKVLEEPDCRYIQIFVFCFFFNAVIYLPE